MKASPWGCLPDLRTRASNGPPFQAPGLAGGFKGRLEGFKGLLLKGCKVKNIIIFQEVHRFIKGKGHTRRYFLASLANDSWNGGQSILNEDEGRALLKHFNSGGHITVDKVRYEGHVSLDGLAIDAREMQETKRIEGNQRGALLEATKYAEGRGHAVTVPMFLEVKKAARSLFLKP